MDMNDKDGLPKPDPEDEAMRAQFIEEMRRRREEQEKRESIEKKYQDLSKPAPRYLRGDSEAGGLKGLLSKFGIKDERSANGVMVAVIIVALAATVWILRGAFGGSPHPGTPPPVTPVQQGSTQTNP